MKAFTSATLRIYTVKIATLCFFKFKVKLLYLLKVLLGIASIFHADVPQPPWEVKVLTVSSRRVQLEWKTPLNNGGNSIQDFIIHYKPLRNRVLAMILIDF